MPHARDFAPELTGLHILCTGNPVDGFTFYGPFKTGADAIRAGERRGDRIGDDSWCIAPLAHPDAETTIDRVD